MRKFKEGDEVICIRDFEYASITKEENGKVRKVDYNCKPEPVGIALEVLVNWKKRGSVWIDKDFVALKEEQKLLYGIGDIVFLTENISGVPKGYIVIIKEFTRRDYAPYVVETPNGHVKLIVTESQISKQEPIQKLDIKSTQDKEWAAFSKELFGSSKVMTVYSPNKSTKPMLAASLLVLV